MANQNCNDVMFNKKDELLGMNWVDFAGDTKAQAERNVLPEVQASTIKTTGTDATMKDVGAADTPDAGSSVTSKQPSDSTETISKISNVAPAGSAIAPAPAKVVEVPTTNGDNAKPNTEPVQVVPPKADPNPSPNPNPDPKMGPVLDSGPTPPPNPNPSPKTDPNPKSDMKPDMMMDPNPKSDPVSDPKADPNPMQDPCIKVDPCLNPGLNAKSAADQKFAPHQNPDCFASPGMAGHSGKGEMMFGGKGDDKMTDGAGTQYVFGDAGYDTFVMKGKMADYGVDRTDDGGVVIWQGDKFDLVYDVEQIVFDDGGYHVPPSGALHAMPDSNMHGMVVRGTKGDDKMGDHQGHQYFHLGDGKDTVVMQGKAADHQVAKTDDGGFVVWDAAGDFDLFWGVEVVEFEDEAWDLH